MVCVNEMAGLDSLGLGQLTFLTARVSSGDIPISGAKVVVTEKNSGKVWGPAITEDGFGTVTLSEAEDGTPVIVRIEAEGFQTQELEAATGSQAASPHVNVEMIEGAAADNGVPNILLIGGLGLIAFLVLFRS
jgi:hypothetical protein